MIGALKRKLTSQRGASLLLALLFLLVCVMVSASILMASVSNAGKHHSNLQEHQTYLALSSAVSLICDELNQTEYRGRYQYWETQTTTVNSDGTERAGTLRHFTQLNGAYNWIGTDTPGDLKAVILSDFDAIFAHEITNKLNGEEFATFQVKPDAPLSHTFVITPQTGTELDDRKVTVELTVMEESCAMELIATLDDYQIQAELTPTTNKPTLSATPPEGEHETDPLQWSIGWIMPREKEATP